MKDEMILLCDSSESEIQRDDVVVMHLQNCCDHHRTKIDNNADKKSSMKWKRIECVQLRQSLCAPRVHTPNTSIANYTVCKHIRWTFISGA